MTNYDDISLYDPGFATFAVLKTADGQYISLIADGATDGTDTAIYLEGDRTNNDAADGI